MLKGMIQQTESDEQEIEGDNCDAQSLSVLEGTTQYTSGRVALHRNKDCSSIVTEGKVREYRIL